MTLDESFFLLCNGHHTPLMDQLMLSYTSPFTWIPFYVACFAALIYKFGWAKATFMLIVILCAVGLSDWFCASVLRPVLHRMRPSNLDNPFSQFVTVINGYRGGRYGLPSCHAANSFALIGALITFTRSKRFSIILIAWGLLVCYSRMYVGVHYPSDLLLGGAIGLAIGIGMANLVLYYGPKIRRYRQSKGYKVYSVEFPLVNGSYTLSLAPIIIPVTVLLLTLVYGLFI